MHEVSLAHLEILDALSDPGDPDDGLVAGDGRGAAGDVARDFDEDILFDTGDDLALANVGGELLEQLQIREAKADGLDFGKNLKRAGLEDLL